MENTIPNPKGENKVNNGQSPKVRAIRVARAEALHEYLSEREFLVLDDNGHRLFKLDGWSRPELAQAVDDLVAKGMAIIDRFGTVLEVRLVSEEGAR